MVIKIYIKFFIMKIVYVWIGTKSNVNEKTKAFQYAMVCKWFMNYNTG